MAQGRRSLSKAGSRRVWGCGWGRTTLERKIKHWPRREKDKQTKTPFPRPLLPGRVCLCPGNLQIDNCINTQWTVASLLCRDRHSSDQRQKVTGIVVFY